MRENRHFCGFVVVRGLREVLRDPGEDWIIHKVQPRSTHPSTRCCILTILQNELIASGHPSEPSLFQLPLSISLYGGV